MPVSVGGTSITFNDATTLSTNPIPTGTVLLFYQAAAPTGWTQVTTQNNKALRVVSSTGGGTGGTTAFTSVFTNQTVSTSVSGTTGSTTLSTAQMPSHTHGYNVSNNSNSIASQNPYFGYDYPNKGLTATNTGSAGSDNSHNHSFSGSGTSSAITLNVQYIDIILASKN